MLLAFIRVRLVAASLRLLVLLLLAWLGDASCLNRCCIACWALCTHAHLLVSTHRISCLCTCFTDPRKASTRVAYWRYSNNELGTQDVAAQLERIHNVKCTELGSGRVRRFCNK